MRAAELHRLARRVRDIALHATGNTGDDRVNAGELAILEDVARHPESTIGAITQRTGLSQSLVSRVTKYMADAGALTIVTDTNDRRKVRIGMTGSTRRMILLRADNSIATALAVATPRLAPRDRDTLLRHLSEAERLLADGS